MDGELENLLTELAAFGREHDARETDHRRKLLNVTPETGRLLHILVLAKQARSILEVGTSNAYSTIWLAAAARQTGGRVTTIEHSPNKIGLAVENLFRAGFADVVQIRQGSASDILPALPGPFDFVFFDADRPNLPAHLDTLFPKIATGALLVADNAVSHPREMAEYVSRVRSHPGLMTVTVPIGNGEEISVKL